MRKWLMLLVLAGCSPYEWQVGPQLQDMDRKAQEKVFAEVKYRCLKDARTVVQGAPSVSQNVQIGSSGGGFGAGVSEGFRKAEQGKPRIMYDDALFRACMENAGFRLVAK